MANVWHLLVTRRIGVQVAQQWNHAFWRMRKPFGIGIDDVRIDFDGRKTEYCVDAAQWRRFEKGMREKLADQAFVRTFARDAKRFLEKKSGRIQCACRDDFSGLSDSALHQRFLDVSAMADEYYTRMWLVFLINEPLAESVAESLRKAIPDLADELLLEFSSPLAPNDAIRERQSLLRIASETDARRRRTRLENHARCFAHIPVFDFNHEPYDFEHFGKELARIRKPQNELRRLQRLFLQRRRKFPRLISKLGLPKNGLELAQICMLSDLAYLRDYRDTLRQKMNLALRNLYGEIARRAGMSIADVSLLTCNEISLLLKDSGSRPGMRQTAKARQSGFSMLETPTRLQLTTGLPESGVHGAAAKLLRGISASPGTAVGTVRIVLTNQDLPKIRAGDVMVATMTRQDFVPYIRRCAALVTDEGGVTCHAAIIARELVIPCVVGTHSATQVLQSGRKIRVDGLRGTVSLLPSRKSP
ncbi:hypothetical protein HYV43_04425 [Candidatus Micrarchaeota archaeon]|nr:hypothetical protein [Candidatus Micrarchaeota archaeon]